LPTEAFYTREEMLMRFVLRSLILSAMLALLPNPAHADKKQDADKKKQEAEEKKLEADKKKHEAEEKKKHEAEKKKHDAEEKKKHDAERKKREEEKKKHEAEERKKHEAKKHEHHTWHGMIVTVNGSGGKGSVNIKHANGGGKTFEVDGKTEISGVATAFGSLKKGQIVTIHYLDKHKHAAKLVVDKQAEKTVILAAKDHSHGTVEKVVSDKFGDNGEVWIKDDKGKTKKFHVGNETTIVWKKDGKDHTHTLQGVVKGQKVKIGSAGKEAVHIEVIMK
jgi:flagellar motor protein MotB